MTEIGLWAARHGVSATALHELANILGAGATPENMGGGSEARTQSLVRLEAPRVGMRLFRNNVGVLRDERGVPVRYGLANESKQVNERLKSADLIGWRRLEIGGQVVAQFVSLECKPAGWRYRGDAHEQAQQRWAALVATDGGHAKFVTGPEGIA